MKSARDLFKNNPSLLEEQEVMALLDYCNQLEEEIIEFKFQKVANKELVMIDMLQEVVKGCSDLEKEQMEHERFGYEKPQYQEAILHLKKYILNRCKDEKIYL